MVPHAGSPATFFVTLFHVRAAVPVFQIRPSLVPAQIEAPLDLRRRDGEDDLAVELAEVVADDRRPTRRCGSGPASRDRG